VWDGRVASGHHPQGQKVAAMEVMVVKADTAPDNVKISNRQNPN
jgi:predicted DNA-binding protein with PD1-like motif